MSKKQSAAKSANINSQNEEKKNGKKPFKIIAAIGVICAAIAGLVTAFSPFIFPKTNNPGSSITVSGGVDDSTIIGGNYGDNANITIVIQPSPESTHPDETPLEDNTSTLLSDVRCVSADAESILIEWSCADEEADNYILRFAPRYVEKGLNEVTVTKKIC